MALPFAWVEWIFMTFAINIGHKYKLITPTQNTFMLIILQFTLVLLINHFYLKQKIYRSDIIAFIILLFAYCISFFNLFSYALGKEIDSPQEKSSKKIKKYYTTIVKKKDKKKMEKKIKK